MSEFAYIEWLRKQTPMSPRVLIGPGDDTAAVAWPAGVPCLVTTDMLLEGSCFHLAAAGPRLVGRKAMAVNLSDIAAMAGNPVAAVVRVRNREEAVEVANRSIYGLGASIWTTGDARSIVARIEAGTVFVNAMVKSDPRLPFGGIKRSGYGRELSELGIREFVNIKSVWIE